MLPAEAAESSESPPCARVGGSAGLSRLCVCVCVCVCMFSSKVDPSPEYGMASSEN